MFLSYFADIFWFSQPLGFCRKPGKQKSSSQLDKQAEDAVTGMNGRITGYPLGGVKSKRRIQMNSDLYMHTRSYKILQNLKGILIAK